MSIHLLNLIKRNIQLKKHQKQFNDGMMKCNTYRGVLWEKPPQDYWLCDFCLLFQLFYDTNKVKKSNFSCNSILLNKENQMVLYTSNTKHGIDKNNNNYYITIQRY